MHIDDQAPAVTRQERKVTASPDRVFGLLADVTAWPSWQPDVTRVEFSGALAVGSTFRWRARGVTITSTVELLDRPRTIGWTGRAIGTRARHVWFLEPTGDGGTLVRTEESMSGWLPRLLGSMVRKTLDGGVAVTLDALAAAA